MAPSAITLTALRVFVAAGRLSSVSRAAPAVHLTQSAASKHLKALEAALGTALFVRHARGLQLTAAGQLYLAQVVPALDALDAAAAAVDRERQRDNHIALGVPPAVAGWVIAGIAELMARQPDINVVMQPRPAAPRAAGSEPTAALDAEIRFGEGPWPEMDARYLLGREASLVASPALVARCRLSRPADLAGSDVPLLRHVHVPGVWQAWGEAMGLPAGALDRARVSDYELYASLIPAAVAGLGLAVVPRFLVADHLKAGALVGPFGEVVTCHPGYHLVVPQRLRFSRPIRALADHLAGVAARLTRAASGALATRTAMVRADPRTHSGSDYLAPS